MKQRFNYSERLYPETLTWAECIVLYRMRLGLTKKHLADVCRYLGHPITRTTIWRVESGVTEPSDTTRKSLEEAILFCNSIPEPEDTSLDAFGAAV